MPHAFALYTLIAGYGAAIGAGVALTTAVAVAATVAYVGLYVGMVVVLGKLGGMIAGKMGGGSGLGSLGSGALSSGSPLQMSRDPVASRRVVYGETRVSGPMLDAFVSGASNEYINIVVGLAGHECQAIGAVYFNDVIEPLDGAGNSTGTYAGLARVKKFLGATGQTADADFVADSGGQRGASDKFDRIAGLYFRGKWDQAKWSGSFPNLSAVVKGRKCYDPRTATTVWTDNPAICVRDYLTNTEFGLGVDVTELDDASFIAAANICDEMVALAAGGTEKRYRLNGSFETSAIPATVLEKMVEAMAGAVVYVGGLWICYAGAHATPEATHLTENDLRGQINVQTKLSMRDSCNRVRGTFISPDEKWQSTDFVPIINALYLSEDGGLESWRDLNFAFVSSHSQAQRLAKIELERTRQGISVSAPCKLTALRYKPGDVVPVDNAEMGWSGKLFVITSLKFSSYDAAGVPALGVDLDLRETAAEVWDWNSGMETTYDPAPNTNLNNPMTVPVPVITLNIAGASELSAQPRLRVGITAPADQFVVSGGFTEIQWKKAADADWRDWSRLPGGQWVDFITDLAVGVNYNVRARFVNSHGVPGAYCAAVSETAPAGAGDYTGNLTNDAHVVACDAEGNPVAGEVGVGGRAFTDVQAWAGATGLTSVASGPGVGQFCITSVTTLTGTATHTQTDNDTVRLDSLTTPSAIIRIVVNMEGVFSQTLDFSVAKAVGGGVYWLIADVASVNKNASAVYTPATVNFGGWSKLLVGAPVAYAGRFIIATWDGSTWTNVYTSAGNESTKAYAVPASIKAIRCRLYLAGGTVTQVDEEIIPITADGANGLDGVDGIDGVDGTDGTNGATVLGEASGTDTRASGSGDYPTSISVTTTTGSSALVSFSGNFTNGSATGSSFSVNINGGTAFSIPSLAAGASIFVTLIQRYNSLTPGSNTFTMHMVGGFSPITLAGNLTVQ